MGHKSDNPNVIVESIKNRVWEWPNDDLVKIEIHSPVDPAVLQNLGQVAIESSNETISESGIPVFVIPSCGLRNIL
jgi:hypothetical protein